MSTLNELDADSVVAAALVAGAFSLVVQGAVRVWEVRQTRVRDRVDAYVAHLMFVRRFITDSILIGDQARRLRHLGEEFDDLDASMFKTPTGELDAVRFQRERARYEVLHADYDRQRRELQERADALMDAQIEQEFRFNLIAKPPVRLRDVQLSRLTAQLPWGRC